MYIDEEIDSVLVRRLDGDRSSEMKSRSTRRSLKKKKKSNGSTAKSTSSAHNDKPVKQSAVGEQPTAAKANMRSNGTAGKTVVAQDDSKMDAERIHQEATKRFAVIESIRNDKALEAQTPFTKNFTIHEKLPDHKDNKDVKTTAGSGKSDLVVDTDDHIKTAESMDIRLNNPLLKDSQNSVENGKAINVESKKNEEPMTILRKHNNQNITENKNDTVPKQQDAMPNVKYSPKVNDTKIETENVLKKNHDTYTQLNSKVAISMENPVEKVPLSLDTYQSQPKIKAETTPDLNTGERNIRRTSNVIGTGKGRINSLDFLHKPQRVTQMKSEDFISPEELKRNTDMNKQILMAKILPDDRINDKIDDITTPEEEITGLKHELGKMSIGNGSANSPPINSIKAEEIIELAQDESISPTEHNYPILNRANQAQQDVCLPLHDSYDQSPVEDHMMPLPPVYKKSGELVKSSLKRRSKSLPVTPNSNRRTQNSRGVRMNNPRDQLIRSKSVHFDQRLPVKYFFKEESPSVVSIRDEEDDVLSFQHKPLVRSIDRNNGRKKRLDLNRRLEGGFMDDDEDGYPYSYDYDEDDDETTRGGTDLDRYMDEYDYENGFSQGDSIFSRGLKSLMMNDRGSGLKDNFKDPTPPVSQSSMSKKEEKMTTLVSKNFPMLGSKTSKSLKLNIFLNSTSDKKVLLQEVSLNVQKRKSNYYNSNFGGPGIGFSTGRDEDDKLIITGTVLVKNIYFDKKVSIRYTWDHWRSCNEVESMYVGSGNNYLPGSQMDIFRFMIDNTLLSNGQYVSNRSRELEFCIQYTTRSNTAREEYWDNNNGKNYIVEIQ